MKEIIIEVSNRDLEALNIAMSTLTEFQRNQTGMKVYPDEIDKTINRLFSLRNKINNSLAEEVTE